MSSSGQEEYEQEPEIVVTDLDPLNPVKANHFWTALNRHKRPLLWFALVIVTCMAIFTFVLALYPSALPHAAQKAIDTSKLNRTLLTFNQRVARDGAQIAYIQFSANSAITTNELNFLGVVDENLTLFHGLKTYHSQLANVSSSHATAFLTWTLQEGPDLLLQAHLTHTNDTWRLLDLSYAHPGSEEVIIPQRVNTQ